MFRNSSTKFITKKDYKNFITCKFYWQLEQEVLDVNFFNTSNKTTFARKAYSCLLDKYEVIDQGPDLYILEGLEFDILIKNLLKIKSSYIDLNDVKYNNLSIYEKIKLTREAIFTAKFKLIINGWIVFQDMICNPDLLEVISKNEVILFEIKARTKPDKKRDIADLAFQYNLISKTNIKVKNVKLILSNTDFFYHKLNDYNGIYKIVETIKFLRREYTLLELVQTQALTVSNVVLQIKDMSFPHQSLPIPCKIHKKCNIDGVYCKYFKFCAIHNNKLDIGVNSLINLYGLKFDKKVEILNSKFSKFDDFSSYSELANFLKEKERGSNRNKIRNLQYLSVISNSDKIDHKIIINNFKKYKLPIYMLDFETFSSIIPKIIYTSPYQQVPFLYSIHILLDYKILDAEINDNLSDHLIHKSFILDPEHFSLWDFIKKLAEDLQSYGMGTIVAYHASFEISVITKLIDTLNLSQFRDSKNYELYKDSINFLNLISNKTSKYKIIDLKDFFTTGGFYRKLFNGKLSIKSVLPAIDKNFSYKSLAIQNGVEASSAYLELLKNKTLKLVEKNKVLNDLVNYCFLDTFAMIIIFKFLYNLTFKDNRDD